MKRIYDKIIIALLPVYKKDIGDSTDIILEDEIVTIEKTIQTVIRLLCKYYMIDQKEIKNIYSDIIITKNLLPIPFGRENIFIPFKYRKPICKNDKAFGYINLNYIDCSKANGNYSTIHLNNNTTLGCLSNIITTKKHINDGYIMKSCYVTRTMDSNKNYNNRLLSLINEIHDDYR